MSRNVERSARPRVAVYAIARDEETQIEQWAASARDADLLLIADTGSTDGTIRRARELGVEVHEIDVKPFRFDRARNLALELLPRELDMCVSLDLDEVLAPGWREQLDRHWREGANKLSCWTRWRWSADAPPLRWTIERIHSRDGYRWRHPVHERLVTDGAERRAASEIEICHLRDPGADRPAYPELLRIAVAECPSDARLAHMLANDARMRGLAHEAATWFRRALQLDPEPNERLHSMLMLSHLEPEQRVSLLVDACGEFGARREPWCELAQLDLEDGNWRAALATAHRALMIDEPADDYLANPFAWDAWPELIAARAAGELREHDWQRHHARRARRDSRQPHPPERGATSIDFVTVVFEDRTAAERIAEALRHTVEVPYTLTSIDNTERNVGWAAACNEAAQCGHADLIAFVDQDLEFVDGWLEPVLKALEADPDLVIAGPRCLDGLPWPRVPIGLDAWVCGACMLVRRDFFTAVSGFDANRFPHEFAETDLERTAAARGKRVQTIEEAHVVHRIEHSKSETVLAWRAKGARAQSEKWGLPLDPWGVAHEAAAIQRNPADIHLDFGR